MQKIANIFGALVGLILIIAASIYMIQEPNSGDSWVGLIFIVLGILLFFYCGVKELLKNK
jgi:multidrug transporter EmrE-like cation transporter